MYGKLAFVLTMLAVAVGSLSQAQAALASPRPTGSTATHSATDAVPAAAATRQIAPRTRLRTQEKKGSRPLSRDRRATETASAPTIPSAASPAGPKITSVGLAVSRACQITISGSTIFTVGQFGSFTVTVTGSPPCTVSEAGALPPGLTWTDNGAGTATISGTPAANTGGTYPFTIAATNGVSPAAIQSFTLTVDQVCQITSPDSATFAVGKAGTFTVTTTGYPTCILPAPLTLPSGVTFTDNKNGTATLAGTPAANTDGTYQFTINATNDVIPDATQSFALTVDQVCQITSPDSATFAVGQAGTFTVTTTGYPTCILPAPLTLPSGVTFTDNKNGTATLAGTPAANTGGTYPFTINATNGVSPAATQPFALTVNQAPGITSPAGTTFTVGQPGTFTVKSTGAPTPGLSETGALPRGVKFKDNGDGTATLAGTPAAGTGGTYPFRITATNVAGSDTQSFTLTVVGLPAAPSGLKATGKGKKTVSLTWRNHASAPSAATAIQIQRSTNARFTTAVTSTTVGPAVTTHIDATVVKGKKYYYRVRAHNTVGDSAWSNVSNVTAP